MTADDRFFPAFASRPRPSDAEMLGTDAGLEGDRLRLVLAGTSLHDLTAETVGAEIEGNLRLLTPAAFRYFLPAFLHLGLTRYDSLLSFVSELVSALSEPVRNDVVKALDRAEEIPAGMGLTPEVLQQLRRQQLEWFDSGAPLAAYRERMTGLTARERAAILDFFVEMRDAHGDDFPLDELQIAIDRHLMADRLKA